jgi:putative nucleotidyltransferase with HDIG domain
MNDQKYFQKTIERIQIVPTLPVVLDKITRLLQNPQTSAEEVGRAITTDPALASKVLKLVNSAFYGFPGRISTITHAIVILGFSTVKNVVLTASIFDVFKKPGLININFDMDEFWLHSVATGVAAQCIARYIGFTETEESFLAGLIHDIGKTIQCQYLTKEFVDIVRYTQEKDILYYDSERELFGITHQEIGGHLAERWNLPPNLQSAIQYHHTPSSAGKFFTISAIVHSADIIARALDKGNGGDQKIPCLQGEVWETLGFDSRSLSPLFETFEDELEKATIFLQLA